MHTHQVTDALKTLFEAIRLRKPVPWVPIGKLKPSVTVKHTSGLINQKPPANPLLKTFHFNQSGAFSLSCFYEHLISFPSCPSLRPPVKHL